MRSLIFDCSVILLSFKYFISILKFWHEILFFELPGCVKEDTEETDSGCGWYWFFEAEEIIRPYPGREEPDSKNCIRFILLNVKPTGIRHYTCRLSFNRWQREIPISWKLSELLRLGCNMRKKLTCLLSRLNCVGSTGSSFGQDRCIKMMSHLHRGSGWQARGPRADLGLRKSGSQAQFGNSRVRKNSIDESLMRGLNFGRRGRSGRCCSCWRCGITQRWVEETERHRCDARFSVTDLR